MQMFKEMWHKLNITKNTTQKLFSLVFAIVFWLFVMDTENPEMIKQISKVPVQLVGVELVQSSGLEVMTTEEILIDVKIKGRRKDVVGLTAADLKATVDVYQATKGNQGFPISVKILKEGVTLEWVSQSVIKLDFDQVISASKPIKINVVGEIPSPYLLDPVKLETQYVEVQGPESVVNQIVNIQGVMDVTGMTASFSTELSLVPVDVNGKRVSGVKLSQDKQKIDFAILVEKRLPIEVVYEGDLAQGYRLIESLLSQDDIAVIGNEVQLEKLTKVTTTPINLADKNTSQDVVLKFNLPECVAIKPQETAKLALKVEAVANTNFSFGAEAIKWLNLKPEYEVALQNGNFEMLVEGPSELIGILKAADISIEADLIGLEPGLHAVPISITVPEGTSWVRPNVETVTLDVLVSIKGSN